jgi:hypothetical protein
MTREVCRRTGCPGNPGVMVGTKCGSCGQPHANLTSGDNSQTEDEDSESDRLDEDQATE